ncbi:hypothetical protein VdG1_07759 [Verticillium dahliae VDG1]|nr:hypothetical protein VdG1_07759 [Verticillium dahliae VDG1]
MSNSLLLAKLRPLGKLEQVSAACHHLGYFNNVGLSAHYKLSGSYDAAAAFDLRRVIFAAMRDVIRKNRILFAIPVNEDAVDTYFASLPSIDLTRSIIFLKRTKPLAAASADGSDEELDAILEKQHNTNFKADYGSLPFWRLIILEASGSSNEFTASFIYHHAIGDGVSGMVFHNAFRAALETASLSAADEAGNEGEGTVVPGEDIAILPPLEELHPLPINPTPSAPPAPELKQWTGGPLPAPRESRWSSLHFSPSKSQAFFRVCKDKSVSVTSGLTSIIATALFGILPPTTEAITCIIPVSLRPWLSLPRGEANGAIGTYFDATKVQIARPGGRPDSAVAWDVAQAVSAGIADYLANVSPTGEPYTAVAPFKGIEDVSVVFNSLLGQPRDVALEVTNVGLLVPVSGSVPENAVSTWEIGRVLLSRSAVASGAAITVSIATGGDGSLSVGFSWQEGVVGQDVIDKLREGVRGFFGKF